MKARGVCIESCAEGAVKRAQERERDREVNVCRASPHSRIRDRRFSDYNFYNERTSERYRWFYTDDKRSSQSNVYHLELEM